MHIDRRSILKFLGVGAAATMAEKVLPASSGIGTTHPNIVVILADDVGYGDISCYGAKDVHTPNIDRLAKNGVRFTNAHADAATCTPSRYAMLTGSYAWRRDNIQILPGDAKLLIEPGQATIASVLQSAGYKTGLVGKWHIGLGNGKIDWNGDIRPGPCEVGFDEAFFFAATADRVPTVYIHNHHVVNLDPKDPITVSYDEKIGHNPTGKEDPTLLKMKLSEGHDGTIVDGVSRIGFMSGGTSALWKDEEIASTFTGKAVEFIEANKEHPFLLYFTPSDIHVPRMPGAQFAGKSTCGARCDVIAQLDWSVGQIMSALHKNGLDENTLIVFTSDNGPVIDDGYADGSLNEIGDHKPAGPFRGGKYSIYEGGTRVPFIVSWTRQTTAGVSDALVCQTDLLASFAALIHQPLLPQQAQDSENVLTTLLGKSQKGRKSLVEEARVLAVVDGNWKFVDRDEWPGMHGKRPKHDLQDIVDLKRFYGNQTIYPTSRYELYDLSQDPYETKNLAGQHPEIVERLKQELVAIRNQSSISTEDRHAN